MDHSFLPIDVCEEVIDAAGETLIRPERNWTLLACALVCRAWLPRSRYSLLHQVKLGTAEKWKRLARFLGDHLELLGSIEQFMVFSDFSKPFIPLVLPRLLPNCRYLSLYLEWKAYPPRYWAYMGQFKAVITLRLRIDQLRLRDMLHFMWSFPELRELFLQGDFEQDAHEPWAVGVLEHIKEGKRYAPSKLRRLELDSVSTTPSKSSLSHLVALFIDISSRKAYVSSKCLRKHGIYPDSPARRGSAGR